MFIIFSSCLDAQNNKDAPQIQNSSSKKEGYYYPYRRDKRTYFQKPTECRALQSVITSSTNLLYTLIKEYYLDILKRLSQKEQKEVKQAVERYSQVSGALNAKAIQQSHKKVEYPGNIQAALINLRLLAPVLDKAMLRVYSTIDFNAYPLLNSTILDNRAATHLVNSLELLVLGSFCLSNRVETIRAGT